MHTLGLGARPCLLVRKPPAHLASAPCCAPYAAAAQRTLDSPFPRAALLTTQRAGARVFLASSSPRRLLPARAACAAGLCIVGGGVQRAVPAERISRGALRALVCARLREFGSVVSETRAPPAAAFVRAWRDVCRCRRRAPLRCPKVALACAATTPDGCPTQARAWRLRLRTRARAWSKLARARTLQPWWPFCTRTLRMRACREKAVPCWPT
jgi:hypothetical protein